MSVTGSHTKDEPFLLTTLKVDSLFEGDQWEMLGWQMSPQGILQQANKEKKLTIL